MVRIGLGNVLSAKANRLGSKAHNPYLQHRTVGGRGCRGYRYRRCLLLVVVLMLSFVSAGVGVSGRYVLAGVPFFDKKRSVIIMEGTPTEARLRSRLQTLSSISYSSETSAYAQDQKA